MAVTIIWDRITVPWNDGYYYLGPYNDIIEMKVTIIRDRITVSLEWLLFGTV